MLENCIKKDNSKVAIIMSVYAGDNSDHLELAMKSLLDQTFKSLTIYICIDGPISSELEKTLNKFRYTPNFKIMHSKVNQGLACSLNFLLSNIVLTNYDYIARMDADDICFDNRIEEQVKFMDNNKLISVSGTYCEEFGSDIALKVKKLPIKHDQLIDFSVTRCPFIHPSVIFRTSVFTEGYRYPINTSYTEDMALWFKLLSEGKKFGNLDQVLIKYRMDAQTLKRRKGLKKLKSEFSLRYKFMCKENLFSTKKFILLILKTCMYLVPVSINKILYKYLR